MMRVAVERDFDPPVVLAGIEDTPSGTCNSPGIYYPMELIRARTLRWLFSGLRSDGHIDTQPSSIDSVGWPIAALANVG